MAYSVGCTRGDMVAGVGVMSGAMLDDAGTCDSAHPVPVIVFHGVGDYVLPYNGNEWYASVADVVSLWLDHNGIPTASQTTASLNGGDVVHDAYSGGNGGTCLSLYTVEQEFGSPGDHVWFSQDMDGVSPSRILWEFFNSGCSAVSAVDGVVDSEFEVHPNPFSDRLSIEGLDGVAMPYTLVTSAGRMVREGKVGPAGTIDGLEDLPAGVYVLRALPVGRSGWSIDCGCLDMKKGSLRAALFRFEKGYSQSRLWRKKSTAKRELIARLPMAVAPPATPVATW